MRRTPADFFLACHCRSVWRITHTARSELSPCHLVLGQPLFFAGCFTNSWKACLVSSTPSQNLMGLGLFVASSPVMARRPPNFLVVSGDELSLQGVNTRLQHLGNAGNGADSICSV